MNSKKAGWKYLERTFNFAVLGVFAVIGISLAVATGRFESSFGEEALKMAPHPQLSLVLLFMTLIHIAGWYFAVSGEIEMGRQYIGEFLPDVPDLKIQALAMAGLLGVLVYVSDRPVVYSAIFSSQKLLEVWLLWIRDSKLREAFETARRAAPLDDRRRKKWDIIEQYYLRKPQLPLAITMMCFALAGLVLSVYGENSSYERVFLSSAYGFLILAIVINEVVYRLWRNTRDDALGERYS